MCSPTPKCPPSKRIFSDKEHANSNTAQNIRAKFSFFLLVIVLPAFLGVTSLFLEGLRLYIFRPIQKPILGSTNEKSMVLNYLNLIENMRFGNYYYRHTLV
uniref:Uncharacterized protein n=1 Tax=Opuntia streptacantha TaxID=393608 RepID=A0A7C9E0K6_OPUST